MSRTTTPEHGDTRRPGGGQETGAGDTDGDGDGRTDRDTTGLRRALSWIALVVSAGAGALLSVGAFLGLYVRPTSDDWCALWKARDMGVLGITADFYRTQNGRVTNAFLTGVIYSDDMRGPKLLPAFLVVTLGRVWETVAGAQSSTWYERVPAKNSSADTSAAAAASSTGGGAGRRRARRAARARRKSAAPSVTTRKAGSSFGPRMSSE